MLDDTTRQKLKAYIPALRSLAKSVHHSVISNVTDGTGEIAVRSYTTLHNRIVDLMPDDVYVTEALVLEHDPEATER